MTWSDEPTYNQIQTIYRWIQWHMPNQEARDAVHWLKEHATRKEVSDEIKRLHDLYYGHKLNKAGCFNSGVWEGFDLESCVHISPEPKLVIDDGSD